VFDVILQPLGMEVIVGNPGTADVVIVDNDGEASVISKLDWIIGSPASNIKMYYLPECYAGIISNYLKIFFPDTF